MNSRLPALEWVAIVTSFGLYVGYHIWFSLRTSSRRRNGKGVRTINAKGKVARVVFSQLVSTRKAGVLGVQQNRNTMMGASFQASISALFFNEVLDILVSPEKLKTLQSFSVHDPFLEKPEEATTNATSVRIGQVTALVVIVTNLVIILLSMLLFAMCVRLSVHSGYYYKAVGHPHALIKVEDAIKLTLESQAVYTIGQRLVFLFPVTAMWFLGPLSMLITSVVVTTAVAGLDTWNPRSPEAHLAEVLEYQGSLPTAADVTPSAS